MNQSQQMIQSLGERGGRRSQNPKNKQRQEFMLEFEKLVKAELGGTHQVEWESATHFWNQNIDVKDAASKYVSSRK